MDGPDGCAMYWADTRFHRRLFSKRQNGGNGLMIWASFSYRGKSPLYFVHGTMDSVQYCTIFETHLIPWASEKHGHHWQHQLDNASCHVSNHTKQYLFDSDVDVIWWPVRSPDLNCIENLWGILVSRVYGGNKQYNDVQSLKNAIQEAWDSLTLEELQALISSMPRRCIEVIEKRGGKTKY